MTQDDEGSQEEQAEAPAAAEKPAPAKKDEAAPAREAPPPGGIADLFKEALPDVQLEAYQGMSSVIIEIQPADIAKVMQAAKDDARLDLSFLRCLFGVDHEGDGLEVVYQLASIAKGHEVTVKTRLPVDSPKVASVTPIWQGANWHERETRDMFGIEFEGHPYLVPLLLPEDMTDHFPLRKSNELAPVEEWQGELVGDGIGRVGHVPSGSGHEAGGGEGGEE